MLAILRAVLEQVREELRLQTISLDEGFQKLHLLGECVIGTHYNRSRTQNSKKSHQALIEA